MRIAIISDIHSNLEALTKALEIIDQQPVDEIVCLGDIVGYGANPNECVEIVRRRCSAAIKGNHDEAVLNPKITEYFTGHAREAIFWTCSQLTQENFNYINRLPLTIQKEDLHFAHASPCSPLEWQYIFDSITANSVFRCFPEPLCFIGHTHIPMIFSTNGLAHEIRKGERFLINVGSIGQPRDRNAQLSFGLFDTDTWLYQNTRSPYDIETAANKILKTSLPPILGYRLFRGE